jgi:WD40 repeat protein
LVREVEGEPGALPLLSHALHETWQRREGRTLTVAGYQATGGVRGAVAQSAEAVYNQVAAEQRPLLRDLLLRLVTPTSEGEPVRNRIPRRTVATDAAHERLVELLVHARLVTSDNHTVELAHESLARAWPRLQTWLDDDVEGQRILRHLALTADAWDSMGRPDSELYRGARLAQALEWQARAHPDLTPTERTFLDTSAEREHAEAATAEERLRQQTRHNRRLRALLGGVAVLLVVALVAGVVAMRQADRADRSAVVADARRVGAQALLVDDVDHSLLLAVEGVRLDESTDTRANLLAALSATPELIATVRTGERPLIWTEVSPDGTVVGAGEAYGHVFFYDTSTRELLGTYNEMPVSNFEFRPDGEQLAVSGQPDPTTGTPLGQPSVRLVDPATFEDEPVQLGGIPESELVSTPHYSADGRFLSATFENVGGDDDIVVVWDLASPQQPVLKLDVAGWYGVVLSPDGSLLYVGEWDRPAVTVYDVATGRTLRSASVPAGLLNISPDGSLLAAADGKDIVIIDAATLTEVRRLQGHSDWVEVIRFSPSGALLASGSDDRTAMVWDVTTGERQELLRGHPSGVRGVAFSPDSATLYTTAGRTVLTWDLTGQRRFIARRPLTERAELPWAEASPTGDAVAYMERDITRLNFVDLRTGRTGPLIENGHGFGGWFSWRADGRRFATGGDDGFVRIRDSTGKAIIERQVAPIHISNVDYTGDGRRLVIVEQTGTTYAIDAETLERDGRPVQIDGQIVNAYASPDNHTAVVFTTGRYSLVDLDSGRVIHEGDAPAAFTGEFSPDGRRLAVGDRFGGVRVLDVETGQWVGPPRIGHSGAVFAIDYAPDGATFATGAYDGAIVLWDAATGAPLNRVFPGRPADGPMNPTFLADGHTILIPSRGGPVFTMDTRTEHWIEAACTIAGRNLTQAEWTNAFGDRPYRETCPADSDPEEQVPE